MKDYANDLSKWTQEEMMDGSPVETMSLEEELVRKRVREEMQAKFELEELKDNFFILCQYLEENDDPALKKVIEYFCNRYQMDVNDLPDNAWSLFQEEQEASYANDIVSTGEMRCYDAAINILGYEM